MDSNGIGYLLKLLKISPTKMGQSLNIDRTLISKWKSGVRKLDLNNDYMDNLLEYLLFINAQRNDNTLENLFISLYNLSEDPLSHKALKKYLLRFISSSDSSKLSPNSIASPDHSLSLPIKIYNGTENQKTCIIDFLDYATQQQLPTSLTFLYGEYFDKYMNDKNFRKTWLEKVYILLEKGFKVDLILSNYEHAQFVVYFPSIILHSNFTLYYYPQPFNQKGIFCIHLLDRKLLVFSLFNDTEAYYCNYSSMFQDTLSISAYSSIVNNIKSSSQPVFKSFNHTVFLANQKDTNIYYKEDGLLPSFNTAYCYNVAPYYLAMSEHLFLEVLEQSYSSKEEIDREIKRYHCRKSELLDHLNHGKLIHFFPLDMWVSFSQENSIIYGEENSISHPPLKLTQHQFKRHMKDLANFLLEQPNYSICFINSSVIYSLPSIHCWCKRNELLCLFDNNFTHHLMLSKNMSFINAFADKLEDYYLCSPIEYTAKEHVVTILNSL